MNPLRLRWGVPYMELPRLECRLSERSSIDNLLELSPDMTAPELDDLHEFISNMITVDKFPSNIEEFEDSIISLYDMAAKLSANSYIFQENHTFQLLSLAATYAEKHGESNDLDN